MIGGALMIVAGFAGSLFKPLIIRHDKVTLQWSSRIMSAQVALISGAMAITRRSVLSLQAKKGLPFVDQVGGWLIISRNSFLEEIDLLTSV